MPQHPLHEILERWARWELSQAHGMAGTKTMLAKFAEGCGQILPAGTAPVLGDGSQIEEKISLSVARLAGVNRLYADVLRLEYGVVRIKGVHATDNQQTRATALGVPSLRTYSRALKTARDWVAADL